MKQYARLASIHAGVVLAGMAFLPDSAYADSSSLFTLGLGAAFGVTHAQDPGAAAHASFGPDLELRLRGLKVLGAELGLSPLSSAGAASLHFESNLRLSALIYLVPLDAFGFYLKAGIGGTSPSDLFTLTSETNSYHAGAGFEIYLGDHFAAGAEFLMLLPGVRSVEHTILSLAAASKADNLAVDDFVHPRNFHLAFALRYFL